MRFGLSGWQSKGAWVSPESVYQYKYLQGNVMIYSMAKELLDNKEEYEKMAQAKNPFGSRGMQVRVLFWAQR